MSSKAAYKKSFEELLKIEKKARDIYAYYLSIIKDEYLLSKLKEIHNDENEHLKIVENIITFFI